MTIHFAAARPAVSAILGHRLSAVPVGRAANDNARDFASDEMLRAALRHFARYGLGAAEHARETAQRAFFAGDSDTYRWWLGVCRALDRRMAITLRARTGSIDA